MDGDQRPIDAIDKLNERLDIDFALQAAGLGVWELDPATKQVHWDARCRTLFGLAKDNPLTYQQAIQYIHPDDVVQVDEAVQWAMNPASGGTYDVTYRTIGADDGMLRWVRFIGRGYFNEADEVVRFAGVAQDVTNDIQAQLLVSTQERFRTMVEQAPVAVAVFRGTDYVIEMANEAHLKIWGRPASDVLGKPLFEALPEAKGQGYEALLANVMATGEPFYANELCAQLIHNGKLETVYFNFVYQPLRETDGTITGVTVVANEITEQVTARQKQAVSQERLHFALKVGQLGSWELDLATWKLNASDLCKLNFGQPLDRPFSYETLNETIHPDDRQRQNEALAATLATGADYDVEYRVIWPDKTVHWVHIRGQLHHNREGVPVSMIGVSIDSTDRKNTEHTLQDSEARFRSLVEEAPVATCLFVGRELRIDVANELIIDIWGKGRSVIGKPLAEALPELDGQPFLAILDNVFTTGETYTADGMRCDLNIDGVLGTYYFDFTYKPLRNAVGEVYAIMDMAVDVTQQVLARHALMESEARYRKLSEDLEELVQQRTEELEATNEELAAANEELAATNEELTVSNEETIATNEELSESNHLLARSNDNLEKFAYIASHDLQEPLRKVQQFGDLLINQYADQLGEGVRYLERMQSAASRMSALIRDLLTFSRIATQQETIAYVRTDEIVRFVLTDLELRIQETGAVVQIDPLPVIKGDRLQLEQLFQNLLSNALKFHREGVTPEVSVRYELVGNRDLPLQLKPARLSKTYHRIDVADNGIGFDEKYLDRIFQVFQRLHGKTEFAGTGIGLAICEKVVASHGGAITATSQPGQGATFNVYLPA